MPTHPVDSRLPYHTCVRSPLLRYGVGLVGEDRDDLLDNGPSLGRLLPLHCGHNNAYSDGERRMLLEHLALEG